MAEVQSQVVIMRPPKTMSQFSNDGVDETSLSEFQDARQNMQKIVSLVGASVIFEYQIQQTLQYLPNQTNFDKTYDLRIKEEQLKEVVDQNKIQELENERDTKIDNLKKIKTTIAGEVEGAINFRTQVLDAFNKMEIAQDQLAALWVGLQSLNFSDKAFEIYLADGDVVIQKQVQLLVDLTNKLKTHQAADTKDLKAQIQDMYSLPGHKSVADKLSAVDNASEAVNLLQNNLWKKIDQLDESKAEHGKEMQLQKNKETFKTMELDTIKESARQLFDHINAFEQNNGFYDDLIQHLNDEKQQALKDLKAKCEQKIKEEKDKAKQEWDSMQNKSKEEIDALITSKQERIKFLVTEKGIIAKNSNTQCKTLREKASNCFKEAQESYKQEFKTEIENRQKEKLSITNSLESYNK